MRALLELFHIVVLLIAALWAKTRKASLRLYVLNGTTLTEITMPITLTSIHKSQTDDYRQRRRRQKSGRVTRTSGVGCPRTKPSVKVVPNDESSAYAVAVGPVRNCHHPSRQRHAREVRPGSSRAGRSDFARDRCRRARTERRARISTPRDFLRRATAPLGAIFI